MITNSVPVAEAEQQDLPFPIDAAIPLFHPAGVPGNIEMEEVVAVRLQIETFTGGICRDKNSDGVFLRGLVECLFDLFPLLGNPVARPATAGGSWKLRSQYGDSRNAAAVAFPGIIRNLPDRQISLLPHILRLVLAWRSPISRMMTNFSLDISCISRYQW